jgi:hypothetical protein
MTLYEASQIEEVEQFLPGFNNAGLSHPISKTLARQS